MLTINILQISSNEKSIEISIETNQGDTINSATLWTDKTFKDYTKSKSLNSYLKQTNNKEVFTVPISEVGEAKIYFIEFTSTNNVINEECTSCNGNTILGITGNLNSYRDCLLKSLLSIDAYCNSEKNKLNIDNSINLSLMIESLQISIQFGYYDQIINIINTLDKLCKNTSCDECRSLITPSLKIGLNFSIFNNNLTLL